MARINQINNLQMSGQHIFEHFDRPALKSLGQDGMVSIGASLARDRPSVFEWNIFNVNQ